MTMRNRKTIITAFVLAACLLIGVGYAAVSGNLTITGATSFQAYGETAGQIHSAVKFQAAEIVDKTEGTAASTSISATGNGDYVDLVVVFTDTTAATDTVYTAVAKYTVVYESNSTTLPEVKFDVPALTANGTSCVFTYYLDAAMQDEWTSADEVKLAPAADSNYNTFDFYVKVTYTENGTESGKIEATPSISLVYSGGAEDLTNSD